MQRPLSAGQTLHAVARTREYYSGRIVDEIAEAKTFGQIISSSSLDFS
ncbi:MAG: hypothetical protein V1862_10705 [Methanobacteriota archaeon]